MSKEQHSFLSKGTATSKLTRAHKYIAHRKKKSKNVDLKTLKYHKQNLLDSKIWISTSNIEVAIVWYYSRRGDGQLHRCNEGPSVGNWVITLSSFKPCGPLPAPNCIYHSIYHDKACKDIKEICKLLKANTTLVYSHESKTRQYNTWCINCKSMRFQTPRCA